MPPAKSKRKSAANGDASETVSKKPKIKEELGETLECQWQWEGDKSVWTAYAPSHQSIITDAYHNKEKEVEIPLGGAAKMRILLHKNVQKNKATGWERRLRCTIKSHSETDFFCWEWQDEHKKWNPYDVNTTHKLEQARAGGDATIAVSAMGRNYTIDINKMEQKNDDTGVIRNMQRKQSVVVTAAEPPVSKSAAAAKVKTESEAQPKEAAARKGSAGVKSKSSAAIKKEPKSSVKTVILKGKAPVDASCPKNGTAHVYYEGADIWDVMLNQTNLQNNNNKYYLIQLLQDDNKKNFSVWMRWGRVGKDGQNALIPCGPDLDEAKQVFCKKFQDKTKNSWAERKKFAKVAGKYDMVHMDYSTQDKGKDEVDAKLPKDVPDSKLDQQLQDLINLICDVKSMEDAVLEMKYDATKAPLGKLTKPQIKAGYAALKIIDACVSKGDFGQKLIQACNDFYTRIPHDFGMQRPPVIRTKEEVKAKIKLIEALDDIEIAMTILRQESGDENPVDAHYNNLKCDLTALDNKHKDYQVICDYVANTHAPTHTAYKMKVLNIFSTNRQGEAKNFMDVGNKKLLWHGSRLTNWVGILSQGLRIAPPEAPVTGYMFGKGVYFADMSSKSANYCFATRSKNTGILLLCEVALGKENELLAADYNADKLPKGKHSVKGLGSIAPDPQKDYDMNGVVVPIGKANDTGVRNPSGYTLNYNEFIVYNTKQVKMRYLVQVQFMFN